MKIKKKKVTKCCNCNKVPAQWMRCTQFSGNHPFCTKCGKKEPNWIEDSSTIYWVNIK